MPGMPQNDLKFLRSVFSEVGALLLILDQDGRICCFNHACERLTGYTAAEAEGKFPWDFLLPPEDAATFRREAFDPLRNAVDPTPKIYVNFWLSKQGQRFLIEWSTTVLLDEKGQLDHVISIGTDITEKRQQEQLLLEQSTIIDQIHDAVVATDLEGVVTFWNKGAERIFGYSAAELVGRNIAEVYPEDQQQFLLNKVIAPLKVKGAHMVEVVMQRKNGERFQGHLSLSMRYGPQQQPIGMIGYTMDITQQKQADAEAHTATALLETVIENIPSMLFLKHADDLRFAMLNKAGEELLGRKREALLGKSDRDFFPAAEAALFNARDRKVLQETGIDDIAEEPIDTPQGTRILHTCKIALRDAQGKAQYLLGISEDITEQKHT